MTTNLKYVNSLILNSYIETINEFVGEEIIYEVNEEKARNLDKDTFKFFEKLAHKIKTLKECKRNCVFRSKNNDMSTRITQNT